MARLAGPDDASRLVYAVDSHGRLIGRAGVEVVLYASDALTTPADVLTIDGDAITGGVVEVDANSLLPLVQFPDGADRVFVEGAAGEPVAVYARTDDRLDTLDAAVAARLSLAGGTVTGALGVNQSLSVGGQANLFAAAYLANTGEPVTPSGGGIIFTEGGALKFKGSSGTVTTLAVA